MAVTEEIKILIDKVDKSKPNYGLTTEEAITLQTFLNNEGALKKFTSATGEVKKGAKAIDGLFEDKSFESLTEYLSKLNSGDGNDDEVTEETLGGAAQGRSYLDSSATENLIKTGTEEFNKQKTESAQGELLRRDLKRKRDNTAVDVYNMADVGLTSYKLADAARLRREGKADEKIAEAALQQRGPMGQRNPYLQDALNRAVVSAEQGLSPQVRADLNRQSLNTLNAGIQAARTAGTGQAGTYGALASTAGLNRLRGFERMATLDQQFRNQNRQLLGNLIGQRSAEDKMLLGAEQMDFFRRRVPYLQAKLAGASATQQAGRKQMFDTLEEMPYIAGNLAKTYYNLPAQRRGIFGNEPVAPEERAALGIIAGVNQGIAVSPATPVTYTAPESGLPLISNLNNTPVIGDESRASGLGYLNGTNIPLDRRLRKQRDRGFVRMGGGPATYNAEMGYYVPGPRAKLNPYDGIVDEGLDQGVPMTGILPPRFY